MCDDAFGERGGIVYVYGMSDLFPGAVSSLLSDEVEQKLGAAIRDLARPLIEEAFQQGFRAGISAGKESVERAFATALRQAEQDFRMAKARQERPAAKADSPRRASSKRKRVASGTLRPLVELILTDSPGLRVAEIQTQAKALDETISPSSVGNELRRMEGTRYRRDGKRWFLIGDTEQELGLALATVPDSSVGPAESGTPSSAGPASLATRVGQAAA
jgi:hypothetical protein